MKPVVQFVPQVLDAKVEAEALPKPERLCLFGLPLSVGDWDCLLAHVRGLVGHGTGLTVMSFLDAATVSAMRHRPPYRDALASRLLLASGEGMKVASRLLSGAALPATFDAATFVPAFLTYVTEPLRIGVVGGSAAELVAAVDALRRHAPWHTVVPVAEGGFDEADAEIVLGRIPDEGLDVMLVSLDAPASDGWIERLVRPSHASLVISAVGLIDTALAGSPLQRLRSLEGRGTRRTTLIRPAGRTLRLIRYGGALAAEWVRQKRA